MRSKNIKIPIKYFVIQNTIILNMRLSHIFYTILVALTAVIVASCGKSDINPVDPRGYFMSANIEGKPWITTRNYKFPRTSYMRSVPYQGLTLFGEDKQDTSAIKMVINGFKGLPGTFTIAEGDSTNYGFFKANRFKNVEMRCTSGSIDITDVRQYSNGIIDFVGKFELSFADSSGSVTVTGGSFRLPLD